jgi:hypothetical protein
MKRLTLHSIASLLWKLSLLSAATEYVYILETIHNITSNGPDYMVIIRAMEPGYFTPYFHVGNVHGAICLQIYYLNCQVSLFDKDRALFCWFSKL